MKTGTIFLLLVVLSSAVPIHYSSSEEELTRFEREIKGSDELTETPETDVDRRKREGGVHENDEIGEGTHQHEHPQIDVRDKRRIKQPTGPTTTTTTITSPPAEEKRSAEHERQENHDMKGGPSEHDHEEHHVQKRSESSNDEEEVTSHSIGDCEERAGEGENDSQNISEPTVEDIQPHEDSPPSEDSLLEVEPGRGLEAVVRMKKATHGKHNQPRVMQKNKSNPNVADAGSPTNNESLPQQPISIE